MKFKSKDWSLSVRFPYCKEQIALKNYEELYRYHKEV